MSNRFLRLIQFIVFAFDVFALNMLALLAYTFQHFSLNTFFLNQSYFLVALNASWVLVSWVTRVYDIKYIVSSEALLHKITHACFYWAVMLVIYLFFIHRQVYSRMYTAIILAGFCVLLCLIRFIYFGILFYFRQSKSYIRRVAIIGFNAHAKKLASYLENESINTEIVGFFDDAENIRELSNYPILSSLDNTIDVSIQHHVSDIYSTIAPEQNLSIYRIMEQADQACIHFRLIPDLSVFIKNSVHIKYFGDLPVLTPRKEPLTDISNRIKKRIFDLIISSLATIFILLWLTPLLAIIIIIESRGPVFFIQKRTGKKNKPFNCIKFRSMKPNSLSNSRQATRNDERMTRVGKFLRRTNLDEFPQLINVLKGEMSLVGPRPHMIRQTEDYSKLINNYMVRQFLKPGITGWAQVNGFRGETQKVEQMQGRVAHDLWYMENWRLWLDLHIIFLTIYKTLKGDKNAF